MKLFTKFTHPTIMTTICTIFRGAVKLFSFSSGTRVHYSHRNDNVNLSKILSMYFYTSKWRNTKYSIKKYLIENIECVIQT